MVTSSGQYIEYSGISTSSGQDKERLLDRVLFWCPKQLSCSLFWNNPILPPSHFIQESSESTNTTIEDEDTKGRSGDEWATTWTEVFFQGLHALS